jgi:hypothetical protein
LKPVCSEDLKPVCSEDLKPVCSEFGSYAPSRRVGLRDDSRG